MYHAVLFESCFPAPCVMGSTDGCYGFFFKISFRIGSIS